MSPTLKDYPSPSPSSPSYFQNPNPSAHKCPPDSGIFNTSFNPFIFTQLNFDWSKDTSATGRTARRKPVKVKKHSTCTGSVCTKHVSSTGKTVNFVFNESNSGGGDDDEKQFSMGSDNNNNDNDNSKSAKNIGSEEVKNSGNGLHNFKLGFGADEVADAGKVNGLEFVFGANINGCEQFGKVNGLNVNDSDSILASSISRLNLGIGEPGDFRSMMNGNVKTQENSASDGKSSVNLDFVFDDDRRDVQTGVDYQEDEFKETVDKMGSDGKVEMKSDANLNAGTSTGGLGNEDFGMSSLEMNSGDTANRNVDSGSMFWDSKVYGSFSIGNQNENRSSLKGRRIRNKQMNKLKSGGAGSCDNLKKQDNNIDSVCDGNYGYIFGSYLGNAFSDIPQSKVSDESEASNIHDPTTNNTLNNESCSRFNNFFVSGSDKRNIACATSDATTLNQKTDEFSKVSSSEEMGKSDTVIKNQNQPNAKTEAGLVKEMVPSSTIDLGFVPKVHPSEAHPTNEAELTNNFSIPSKVGVFGTSFTGFNTPDINLASSFTSDMFSGLGKKLDFSKTNSVGQRKLKKTKAKLRQQGRNRQQGGPNLSKEVEASGCSPMDFSPYGGTECVSTSTNPATSQVKVEDAVDTTDNPSANNFSLSSATSFTEADVFAKQRPHRKKYILKTGQGVKCTTSKVASVHESTSGKYTKDSDQEICDKWRKRGNLAYKKGDISEAEVSYSKGISSIQHTESPACCVEPLLLCYSNRAAARMALGRLREGLKDCRTAVALDPTFVKANLRSANCHLLLGELEDASYNYNKCLESENIVCLDRRLAIEAADGLQKAQKVTSFLKQSAELLQQKTFESATTALGFISDALSLSCYSEKLLNMKGDALCVLGKHKDVVQLCEQTLDSAEKNFGTESKLWRWNLMSKSYFHLGRLDVALDFLEKYEQLRPTADKIVDPEESLTPLAVTIRELLHCKKAGNEAFQNGKHTEAVVHYSAAISKSVESHSFAAVCFCNRAAAHQSLGEIIDAIGDCSTAIALDGTYPKALSRRSTLWEMIRDYKHAADDLQRLISIIETQSGENSKRSNGSVKDLRRARHRLSSIEENSKKERSLDLYLILGIKPSDTAAEVKKAYRKAALRHHPDKAGQVIARAESGSDGKKWKEITESIQLDADKLFKMIGEAYAVLSDSTKRSKYDLEEEMWDDMNTHASSSSRRASEYYSSPYETSNRRNSHYSTKTYGHSHHHYWEDPREKYHYSYRGW